jgi:membrane-bound ClpP family serine protease
MKIFTRKLGIWMIIIGIAFQFLNILTYGFWEIDIDILGVLIFIIGVVITIVKWKSKKGGKKKNEK